MLSPLCPTASAVDAVGPARTRSKFCGRRTRAGRTRPPVRLGRIPPRSPSARPRPRVDEGLGVVEDPRQLHVRKQPTEIARGIVPLRGRCDRRIRHSCRGDGWHAMPRRGSAVSTPSDRRVERTIVTLSPAGDFKDLPRRSRLVALGLAVFNCSAPAPAPTAVAFHAVSPIRYVGARLRPTPSPCRAILNHAPRDGAGMPWALKGRHSRLVRGHASESEHPADAPRLAVQRGEDERHLLLAIVRVGEEDLCRILPSSDPQARARPASVR